MRIGFDFDKVLIDFPPLVPYFFIDFLYKGTSVFKKRITKNDNLHYRFPGTYEQRLRILSHHPSLRKPIKSNLAVLREISKNKKNKTFLISSRFSFLKKRTDVIIRKFGLAKYFNGIHFNYENEQPHEFKENTIKKLNIETYIDDDLQLSLYLAKKIPNLKVFWVTAGRSPTVTLPKNITPIKDLRELKKYIKI